MKKVQLTPCGLFIIILFITPIFCKSEYNLTIGHTEIYRVESSYMDVKVDDNVYTGDGFVFASNEFSCPQTVHVELVSYNAERVYWKTTIDDWTEQQYINSWEYIEHILYDFIISPIEHAVYFSTVGTQGPLPFYDAGFGFWLFPFFNPSESLWLYLENLEDEISNAVLNYTGSGIDIDVKYDYWEDSGNVHIESWNGGVFDGNVYENVPINVSFENSFICSFEKSTGILNGMKIRGFCVGTVTTFVMTHEVDLIVDYHVTRQGFSLPDYQYCTYDYSQNSGILIDEMLIFLFSSIFVCVIYQNNKRKE